MLYVYLPYSYLPYSQQLSFCMACYKYSETSIIRTPVFQFNHKGGQISELVQMNEVHSFIYRAYSNKTYTTLIEHTLDDKIL